MYGLNRCEIIGHLGGEPDLTYTEHGTARCTFRVAVNEQWRDHDGNAQERTEWFGVVAFGRRGEIAGEYLTKGSRVYVAGPIRTNQWQDSAGQTRVAVELKADEVILLDARRSNSASRSDVPADEQAVGQPTDDGDAPPTRARHAPLPGVQITHPAQRGTRHT
jgi:single-strand DNA-binding protein